MSVTQQYDFYIVTGTTRGIGEALAHLLLGPENVVFCISRNANPSLGVEAFIKQFRLTEMAVDLAQTEKLREVMRQIFRQIEEEHVRSITLINNAGVVHPIRSVGSGDSLEAITRNLNVNLEAAMLISDIFIRETQPWEVTKRIVNLSSGAAQRPKAGWSAYCVAKAGLEMFTRCVALEQENRPFPVKIVSYDPGVVNTEMQAEIRDANPDEFPELPRFLALKENGDLREPRAVAASLISLLHSPAFGSTTFVDIDA